MTSGGRDGLDLLRPGGEFHLDYAELLSGSTATLDDLSGFGRAIEGEWGWLYERATPGERDVRATTAGLTPEERQRLEDVVGRRLGFRADAKALVAAYLAAMERNAFTRTVEIGPVPTSLTAERSAVLIEISRQLKRVIEDFEIQALFRVTAAQARSMRTTLLATYSDDADDLTIDWSLIGAKNRGPPAWRQLHRHSSRVHCGRSPRRLRRICSTSRGSRRTRPGRGQHALAAHRRG